MSEVKFKLIIDGKQVDAVLDNTEGQLKHIKKQSQTVTEKFANWSMIVTGINQGMQLLREATQWIGEAIDKYEVQEKAEAKVTQGILSTGKAAGFTAEELFKVSSELQDLTTISDEEILNKVTAQLLTFTNITGDNFLRTQKVAMDLATVLDGDLQSASIMLGKALNDPVANLSALSRAGIQFSVEQKENVKNLVQQNKLFDAQSLILKELERQYGGQAEALAQTDTGKIAQAYNQMGDNMERVGKLAAEIYAPIIQGAADAGSAIFKWLLPVEDEIDKLTQSAAKQVAEFDLLSGRYLELAKKTKLTKEQQVIYNRTIQSLNDKYPNYLKNVNLYKDSYEKVKIALDEARTSLDKYTQSLVRKAVLEKLQKQLAEVTAVIIANEAKKLDYATVTQEKLAAMEGAYGKKRAAAELARRQKLWTALADTEIKIAKEKAKKIEEEISKATKVMDELFGDAIAPKTFNSKVNVDVVPSQTSIDEFGNLITKGLQQAPVKPATPDLKFDDKLRIDALEEGLQKELELNEYYRRQELEEHARNQAEKYYINEIYDAKRKELEEDSQKRRIELEYEATNELLGAMNELFDHSKGISYVMAIISAYESFNAALAMKPWSPMNYVFAAAALIKGVATAKKISEQKAPKAETGGWITGNRHTSGGTMIEAERDEFIVNRNSALKNAALLEAINTDRAGELRNGTIQAIINVQSGNSNASIAEIGKIEMLFNKHFEKLDNWQKDFVFKQNGEDLYAVNQLHEDKKNNLEF